MLGKDLVDDSLRLCGARGVSEVCRSGSDAGKVVTRWVWTGIGASRPSERLAKAHWRGSPRW